MALPALPGIKIPKIAPDRKKAFLAVGVVIVAMLLLVFGWTLFVSYSEERQVEVFRDHIAASEADLGQVSARIIAHMSTTIDDLSLAECDAYVREFAAIASYGRAVTAYHQQIIAADTVPEAYVGAQAAYLRALDNLNRAFTFWLSAATAYEMRDYAAAEQNLARADEAWRDYITAIGDYEAELRAAEERGEVASPIPGTSPGQGS